MTFVGITIASSTHNDRIKSEGSLLFLTQIKEFQSHSLTAGSFGRVKYCLLSVSICEPCTRFNVVDCVWNVMAHAQKPDFVFRRNGPVHLNRRGSQFSPLLAAELCESAVVMLDTPCSEVVWRVLATHSFRQFPSHFPSLRHRVPSHFNWTVRNFTTSLSEVKKKMKLALLSGS